MGPRTRDPLTLIDRAEALAAAGMRVMIVEPAEPVSVKRSLGFSLDPVRCGSRTLGLKVHARHSAAATKWGLLDGDVIVAVNGHPIDQPDHAIEAYATARREKVAVIEVARADARVVVVLALDEI